MPFYWYGRCGVCANSVGRSWASGGILCKHDVWCLGSSGCYGPLLYVWRDCKQSVTAHCLSVFSLFSFVRYGQCWCYLGGAHHWCCCRSVWLVSMPLSTSYSPNCVPWPCVLGSQVPAHNRTKLGWGCVLISTYAAIASKSLCSVCCPHFQTGIFAGVRS